MLPTPLEVAHRDLFADWDVKARPVPSDQWANHVLECPFSMSSAGTVSTAIIPAFAALVRVVQRGMTWVATSTWTSVELGAGGELASSMVGAVGDEHATSNAAQMMRIRYTLRG